MSYRFHRILQIIIERIKVPGKLVGVLLHLLGLYRRGLRNAHDLQYHQFDTGFEQLPEAFEGFKILILSDLHIDSDLHIIPRLCRMTSQISSDIVVLLGDFRYRIAGDYSRVIPRMQTIIDSLAPKGGIYAVRGNHDSKALMDQMENLGVRVLDNQAVLFKQEGGILALLGVDDPHYDRTDDLPAALSGVPNEAFKILLAHTAEVYREAADAGIQLYLCGHTHGGQINLKRNVPVITNVHAPRRFVQGWWHYRSLTGYTTTGVGVSAVPVRFNCPPEIVLLTLKQLESK